MQITKKFVFLAAVALFVASFAMALPSKALTVPGWYGLQPQVLGASISCPTSYDINADGIVNSLDLTVILSHMGQNYKPAELDGNNVVDSGDVTLLTNCWFSTR